MSHNRLTLAAAILININIMMGVGIFINTVELSKRTGVLGAFLYPLMGLLILPLIMSIAELMKIHPSGGFYIFGSKEIKPIAGFIAAWSYFTGKLASAMLMIHVAVSLLRQIMPILSTMNIYLLDSIVLVLFIALNMLNIRTGSFIQMGFLGMKLLPVLSVIALGLWFFDIQAISTAPVIWQGIPSSLPLVLYAAMGFEATVSLSSHLHDPGRNGPKAIYYSFITVMVVIFLFQFCFYGLIGDFLSKASGYLQAFPHLATVLFGSSYLAPYFLTLMHLAIAFSALGGSYGVLYSNSWNLYTLAEHRHTVGASLFTTLNCWGVPFYCVLTEGFLCAAFLAITAGAAAPLQQVSALSSVIAYTISVVALFAACYLRSIYVSLLLPCLGLISCLILGSACIRNFFISGLSPLMLFLTLNGIGIGMFFYSQKNK